MVTILPKKSSLSPATVIHPQLSLFLQINRSSSRVCPSHRVISSSVYSPAELSSPAGLFSQSYSFTIPSGNEEFNSFLQQQSGIYFPQLKTSHFHTSWHAYASYNTISFILRTSLLDTYHALHTTNPLPFRKKIQSNSHQVQAMKPGFDRIVSWFLHHIMKPGERPDNNIRTSRNLDYDQIVVHLRFKLWNPD